MLPESNEDSTVVSTYQAEKDFPSSREIGYRAMLLDAILRALPIGLTVHDASGTPLLINEAAAAQFGTTARPIIHLPQSAPLVPDDSGLLQDTLCEGVEGRLMLAKRRAFRAADQSLIVCASIDVSEQKAIEDELSRRAFLDELTGLPKRTVIEARVNQVLQCDPAGARFALVFLDIDNFKYINDYYGHAVGDCLLVTVAKRMQRELLESDLLARIGGDEFLILLNPIEREREIGSLVDHLQQLLKAPFFIDGFEVFASASIGVSLYPDHGRTYDTLRRKADIAMYSVKAETKGSFAVFDLEMEREAAARTELEQSLRLAILERRFRCAFQPKVDIRTRDIIGVEALVRLYGDGGIIQAPGQFIELAVELGLIDELTHQMLHEVMVSIDLINQEFGKGSNISLNVAAKQACDGAFMRSFVRALKATGCPERFIIEVTEDAFVRKGEFQAEILPELRAIGVRVSIDDFGTGYSSLSALAEISADEIKIDRSFITDIHKRPRSQAVLRAIESLGEALGMAMIAEGVETFEELAYLQAATRIRYAQGYYFSKPLFIEDLKTARGGGSTRLRSTGRRSSGERVLQLRTRTPRRQ
jgi:diguanylate cyclase (GGDEF)-like protein